MKISNFHQYVNEPEILMIYVHIHMYTRIKIPHTLLKRNQKIRSKSSVGDSFSTNNCIQFLVFVEISLTNL